MGAEEGVATRRLLHRRPHSCPKRLGDRRHGARGEIVGLAGLDGHGQEAFWKLFAVCVLPCRGA